MQGLESEIDDLIELDKLRAEALRLRDRAMTALTAQGYGRGDWRTPSQFIEKALTLKAIRLCRRKGIPCASGLDEATLLDGNGTVPGLMGIPLDGVAPPPARDSLVPGSLATPSPMPPAPNPSSTPPQSDDEAERRVPLFRAARVLQALAMTPGYVFTPPAFRCYYSILRELHTVDPPDYTTGGVRAGEGAMPTAFVTGECVRAVLQLAEVHASTAKLLREIDAWSKAMARTRHPKMPKLWREQEEKRANTALFIAIARLRNHVFTPLDELEGPDHVSKFVADFPKKFAAALDHTVSSIDQAIQDCDEAREAEVDRWKEADDLARSDFDLRVAKDPTVIPPVFDAGRSRDGTESAHLFAQRTFKDGLDRAAAIRDAVRATIATNVAKGSAAEWPWGVWADSVDKGTWRVKRTLRPAEAFLKSVMDRELTEAAADRRHCDYPELAFAAASYSAIREANDSNPHPEHWQDPRLEAAAALLTDALGSDGLLPVGRPIHVTAKGYRLDVVGFEVTQALARVLRRARLPLTPVNVCKMMRLFKDTQNPSTEGWGHEHMAPMRSAYWTTALSGMALHRIVRMLDEHIRRRILPHFLTRRPWGLPLSELFYPDYGIAWDREPRMSVSQPLLRMHAHLAGVPEEKAIGERLWSMVLYGPPGTGKTTIAEALSASARVPLVEVTPSDLIVTGGEVVERRARVVLRALAMLTDVVILFDEFDSVLRRRQPGGKVENVFEFLTPGMLPKLKELYTQSKNRRVAYLLATNMVGTLDEAAIREGRFDAKVGVYPPDPVARTGRLLSQLVRWSEKDQAGKRGIDPALIAEPAVLDRVAEVVRRTTGGPMPILGKPGWFTAPKGRAAADTPFQFIKEGHKTDASGQPVDSAPQQVKREKELPNAMVGEGEDALREFGEWRRVARLDRRTSKGESWGALESELIRITDEHSGR